MENPPQEAVFFLQYSASIAVKKTELGCKGSRVEGGRDLVKPNAVRKCKFRILFFLRSDSTKKSARKNPRGKNAATRLPKNVTVFYCGGGLLIGPGMWLTIYMAYFFPGHEH